MNLYKIIKPFSSSFIPNIHWTIKIKNILEGLLLTKLKIKLWWFLPVTLILYKAYGEKMNV